MIETEVAIVGAGPVGIELAAALGKRGIPYLVFDAGQVGQTMYWWPPQTRWFSSAERMAIAGVPLQTTDQNKVTREDYLRYLRTVVLQFGIRVNSYEKVVGIQAARRQDDTAAGFLITTRGQRGERAYHARRVVLATGGTALPAKLGVPGEDLPHVSHYLQDPHKYFQKKVLVVGGRNSAIEAALRICHVGAEVSISYRRGEFDQRSIKYWLYPEFKSLVNAGRIRAYMGSEVKRIEPAGVQLAPAQGARGPQEKQIGPAGGDGPGPGEPVMVEADFVLLMVGYVADMSLAVAAGVELKGPAQTPVYNPRTMETNVPGIFIAGTAVAGTQQQYRVFLENCHIHTDRIVAAMTGQAPPEEQGGVEIPES